MTISQIAGLAGVSRTTVSRVLNNKEDVNEETRRRVLSVIQKEQYHPSIHAKRNVLRKINIFGLVIANSLERVFIGTLNSEIIRGILARSAEEGYDVTICSDITPQGLVQMYLEKRFDGYLILNPNHLDPEGLQALDSHRIPFVSTAFNSLCPKGYCVDIDNEAAGYGVAAYLLETGHRSPCCVLGPANLSATQLRLKGFCSRYREAGIEIAQERLVEGGNTVQGGYECMKRLLERQVPLDSVFAFNDYMAVGVLRAAEEQGLEAPEAFSVVGFDGTLQEGLLSKPLATVRQSGYRRGYQACQKLFNLLSGGHENPVDYIDYELSQGKTVARREAGIS